MSSQRTDIPKQAPLVQFSPHGAQNYFLDLVAPPAVAGKQVVVQAPYFRIPAGASVSVRSTSVATATPNQGDVYMSTSPEDLNGNLNAVMHILAGSAQILPVAVDNLNELWFTAGDVATGGSIGISIVVPKVE